MGLRDEFRQVRESSSAVAAELRTFLQEHRGRDPQQVLGAAAQSSLVRSVCLSAGVAVVLLVGSSAVSWALWGGQSETVAAEGETASSAADSDEAAGDEPAAEPADANATEAATSGQTGNPAIDRLGISEVKDAPPDVNPLELSNDDLFNE